MNTPTPTKGRIQRGNGPSETIGRSNYRRISLAHLLRDFSSRCAYSMMHLDHAGGERCMEVDHFDPRKKQDDIQVYDNLFLASRHCNLIKKDWWPNEEELSLGIRYLNPCEEKDYGVHIFEDPTSNELIGTTPAGKTQIRRLDLNAPWLVRERKRRSEVLKKFHTAKDAAHAVGQEVPQELTDLFLDLIVVSIPNIKPPPV